MAQLGVNSLPVPQIDCGPVLPRGQMEANVEASEMEHELSEDKALDGVQQDTQPQELAHSGGKQNGNCQLLELSR